MTSQFHFKGFHPDDEARAMYNASLSRVLDRAPAGSRAVALVEKQGEEFRCAVDLYSPQGPFVANAFRASVAEAIRTVEEKLRTQIDSYWARCGTLDGSAENNFIAK